MKLFVDLSKLTPETRTDIAEHLESAEALAKLAKDDDSDVRFAVAENANTTAETLAKLANDNDCSVRCAVAENANTTAEVLAKLAKDEDCDVRCTALGNANLAMLDEE